MGDDQADEGDRTADGHAAGGDPRGQGQQPHPLLPSMPLDLDGFLDREQDDELGCEQPGQREIGWIPSSEVSSGEHCPPGATLFQEQR